ncbi:hypothetical protein M5E88_03815 [Akkermansia muciniphila]|nr:hypothetical protein M5E88_03815 [Akkermansia muciniphila]
MSWHLQQPPTIQGTLNAGSPEYVLDLLHQIIPARNIRTNLHMNAPETCLARAPDDFGRIWNKRGEENSGTGAVTTPPASGPHEK